MAAFTEEQREILEGLMKCTLTWPSGLDKVLRLNCTRTAALQLLLIRKGFITPEELDDACKELDAMVAVEEALNPQLAALDEELIRILRGEAQERDDRG